jgi:2,5-diketo-D-gluconate reductase B
MEYLTQGGLRMPKLGLGTWKMAGAECVRGVEAALARGYRHIDTAQMYGNEDAVGEALAATAVPRADIHVTTGSGTRTSSPTRCGGRWRPASSCSRPTMSTCI